MKDMPERADEITLLDSRWPHINLAQIPQLAKMDAVTLRIFDLMCDRAWDTMRWQHHINSSYRDGDTGQHGLGKAIDFYFFKEKPGDVLLMNQLIFALQYGWTGVGFYPYWNTPGIHVDTRDGAEWKKRRAIWYRDPKGAYKAGFAAPGGVRNA